MNAESNVGAEQVQSIPQPSIESEVVAGRSMEPSVNRTGGQRGRGGRGSRGGRGNVHGARGADPAASSQISFGGIPHVRNGNF